MLGKLKARYIQSKPPENGVFIHHAHFGALKEIVKATGALKEGKPYKGISLTTDPGRFLSPLPMFAATVDGFAEFSVENLITDGYAVPCLYTTYEDEVVAWAEKHGYKVFNEPPAEYKYILRFVQHRDMFLRENEWCYLGEHLNLPNDYKVYITRKLHKRFLNATRHVWGDDRSVCCLDEHPLLRKPA